MEYSARLFLNSSSGCSRKRLSRVQSVKYSYKPWPARSLAVHRSVPSGFRLDLLKERFGFVQA